MMSDLNDAGAPEGPTSRCSDASTRTVLDATRAMMRQLGLTTIFGNPGSTEEGFLRDWPADFTYVLGLQEASVLGMADGWSRVMHRPALVSLHTSAGVGNAMGNLVNAWYNKSPLIILAGQQTREMSLLEPFLTNVDATTLPRPYVKFAHEPLRAEDVPACLMYAYAAAAQPPSGPVFLSVPLDDWHKPEGRPAVVRQVQTRLAVSEKFLLPVAQALKSALAPVLVIGDGVSRSGGWAAAVNLAEALSCAVFSAPLDGGAFPEDHPLYRGALPPAIAPLRQALTSYDVVLVVGAPLFRYYPFVDGDYMPVGTTVFHIVDDAAEASRAPIGTSLLADPADAMWLLSSLLVSSDRSMPEGRMQPTVPEARSPMTADAVMHALSSVRPEASVLVFEAPTALSAVQRFWPCRNPDSFFFPAGGGLGYGLPAAVGIAIAERQLGRNRPVVILIGDGALHYSIQALHTASALSLPVVVIVLDNQGYAVLKQFAFIEGLSNVPGLDLKGIDVASIARGYGCSVAHAATPAEVRDSFRAALQNRGPTVIISPIDTDTKQLM